jgi:hypothetical protein
VVSRKSKLKLYWSVIRPVVVYGCETRVLKESVIQKLSVFERKILRKIFAPTKKANGIWRIKTNNCWPNWDGTYWSTSFWTTTSIDLILHCYEK